MNQNKNEGFQSTATGYQADIEAIRNLSSIATQLQAGGITVPGNLTASGLFASGLTINERHGNPLVINNTKNSWLFNNYPNDDKLGIRGLDANGNWSDTRLSISQKGDLKIASKLATNNLDPNNMPDGWGGGIRTYDLYSSATIACGPDGKQIKSYLNSSGDGYFAGNLNVGSLKIGNTVINEDHLKILTTAKFPGDLSVVGDIVFDGDNKWIIHTPDDGRKTLYIAPMENGAWNWDKQFKWN